MNRAANSDVFFLPDEKFDFDVSLSPTSSTGEDFEDEVFIGPVGHKERCISVSVASRVENSCVQSTWSPLSGDQLDVICEEAQKLANELQSSEHAQFQSENTDPNCANIQKNEFVQDAEAKLKMFCDPPRTVLSPIKRETFCIQDSPLKQLPPAIQSRILKAQSPRISIGSKTNVRPNGKTQLTKHPVSSRPKKSISSPVAGTTTQTRMSLRGRSSIGVGVVLPSRPTAPKAPQSITKNPTDKSRLQPSSKLSTSWRRSPASSRNGSCEDLLSDSASVASDVSDCSLNSSSVGKRTLAPPTKSQGVRTRSGVKPPSDRRKTSSSSSSVSSFNSSFSQSPANKGKRSSSQASLSSVTQPKPAQKSRRSVAVQPLNPPSSAAGRRSLSTQARNPSYPTPQTRNPSHPTPQTRNPSHPTPQTRKPSNLTHQTRNPSNPTPQTRKPSNPTHTRRPESSPAHTPKRRGSEWPGPVPSAAKIHINGAKTKPQATVLPTPSGALQGSSSPDASKMMKPKRLISVKNVDSLPQKPALTALTPSGGSSSALQLKARRPSALPTPLRSRPSGLTQATPMSQVRPIRALPTPNRAPTSPTPAESESPESAEIPLIPPFNLEEDDEKENEPRPPTPAKPDQSQPTSAPVAICLSQMELREETEQEPTLKPILEPISKAQPEVLLLDLPTPALQPQEKLLIDLSNTPDLIRTKTCPSSTELIDLSSPLIKWSPVEKKEKDAPLINLSF